MRKSIFSALLLLLALAVALPAAGQSERPAFNWRASSFSLPRGATFTRASTATRINRQGAIEVVSAGRPRFDFDPVTHELRGLLFEPQRTRLNTVAAAPTVAEVVNVAATSYVLSFYGTGSVTLSGVATGTVMGLGAYPARVVYTFTPESAGTLTLTPSGTVQHLQLEAGTSATSAIVGADGSQLTRDAEYLRVPVSTFRYDATKGTLYVEYTRAIAKDVSSLCGVTLGDGTANTFIGLCNNTGGNNDKAVILSGGTPLFDKQIGLASTNPVKKAVSWAASNIKYAKNGNVVDSGSVEITVPSVAYLDIGSLAGSESLHGHVMAVQYYKIALPENDLNVITANLGYVEPGGIAALPGVYLLLLLSEEVPAE